MVEPGLSDTRNGLPPRSLFSGDTPLSLEGLYHLFFRVFTPTRSGPPGLFLAKLLSRETLRLFDPGPPAIFFAFSAAGGYLGCGFPSPFLGVIPEGCIRSPCLRHALFPFWPLPSRVDFKDPPPFLLTGGECLGHWIRVLLFLFPREYFTITQFDPFIPNFPSIPPPRTPRLPRSVSGKMLVSLLLHSCRRADAGVMDAIPLSFPPLSENGGRLDFFPFFPFPFCLLDTSFADSRSMESLLLSRAPLLEEPFAAFVLPQLNPPV